MATTEIRRARAERARLRAGVRRCGRLLGWPTRTVIALSEDLARRPWKQCTWGELDGVLDELWTVVRAGELRQDRTMGAASAGVGQPGASHARRG